jgi:hypothetical protein
LGAIDKAARGFSLEPIRKQVTAADKAFNVVSRTFGRAKVSLAQFHVDANKGRSVIGAWGNSAEKSGRQAKLASVSGIDLGRAIRSINTAAKAYSLDPMRKQVMAADQWFNKLPRSVRAATSGLAQFYEGTRKVKDGLKGLPAMIKSTDKMMERLSNATIVTDGMARRGQAMMAPFRAANTAAGDFERQMTGFKITGGLTDDAMKPIRASIMTMSRDLNLMPNVISDSFGRVWAEGVYKSADDITTAAGALVRATRLVQIGGEDLSGEDGGGAVAALATSLGIDAAQLDLAFAKANASAKAGGVKLGNVLQALPRQAAAMKAFGFTGQAALDDILAANQIGKRTAGSSQQATNNIGQVLEKAASPEVLQNFKDQGVDLLAAIRAGVASGKSPLETVANISSRLTNGGELGKLKELFGDQEAGLGILALIQNLEEFKTLSSSLKGENVLAEYGADMATANSDAKSSAEGYAAAIARLAISTGKILAPAFTWAANMAEKFADWLVKLEEGANPIGRIMVGAAAGIGIFMAVAGSVGSAVIGMLGPILIIKKVLPFMGPLFGGAGGAIIGFVRVAATAMATMGSAMFASPIGWIVLLIAAIAGAAYLIVKNWDTVKAWFGTFWTWMMTSPMAWLLGPITLVVRMGAWIVKNWDVVKIWFGKFWAWMTAPIMEWLAGPIADVIGVVAKIKAAWEPIKAFFSDLWGGIKSMASSALEAIMGWIAPILTKINGAWTDSAAKMDQAAENTRAEQLTGARRLGEVVAPSQATLLANRRASEGAGSAGAGRGRPPANVTNNWNITAPNAPAVQRAVQRTPQARGALHD